MIAVNDKEFDTTVLMQSGVVAVDFWASWCGPCKMFTPTVESAEKDLAGKAVFFKVDADENSETCQKFGVRGLPTLILFKDGEEVERIVGNQPLAVVKDAVEKH